MFAAVKNLITSFALVLIALTSSVMPNIAEAAEKLTVVENEKVCMVTDMYFAKPQIPVSHEGKTYYGCCQNCKATLSKDATARKATDPVSGKPVDKATAVIAARADNSVLYFESKKTLEKYLDKK